MLTRLLMIVAVGLVSSIQAFGQPARPDAGHEQRGLALDDRRGGLAEDSIMVHLRVRDAILQHHVALTGMATFRQQMSRQLSDFLATSNTRSAEATREQVRRELQRLAAAEPRLLVAESAARDRDLADFDTQFPLRLDIARGGAGDAVVVFSQLRSGLAQLQFANNTKLRELGAALESVLLETEQKVRGTAEARIAELHALPRMFYQLVGRQSFQEMTPDDVRRAIDAYRSRLTSVETEAGMSPQERSNLSTSVRTRLEQIGQDIRTEITLLEQEVGRIQNAMLDTARTRYSNTVGENSFYALLLVFAVIFVLLLTAPLLYKNFDNDVAKKLLTSQFILQFSTVFVLTSAILILGIGRFIKDDQLPVLLAGISGYVLGQLGRSGQAGRDATPGG